MGSPLAFVMVLANIVVALASAQIEFTTPQPEVATAYNSNSYDLIIDGINLNDLSQEEVDLFLQDQDTVFITEIDSAMLKDVIEARKSGTTTAKTGVRRKRALPIIAGRLAFMAARAIFRGATSVGRASWKPSRSGPILTKQYTRRGSFQDAVRDFNRFKPKNQSSWSTGSRGQVGKHEIKVRSQSSGGQPTLEIRSPRSGGGTTVRKFRYKQN